MKQSESDRLPTRNLLVALQYPGLNVRVSQRTAFYIHCADMGAELWSRIPFLYPHFHPSILLLVSPTMAALRAPRLSNAVIDDTNPMLQYTGNWGFSTGAQIGSRTPFNNSLHQASTVGDTVTISFSGQSILSSHSHFCRLNRHFRQQAALFWHRECLF